MAISDHSSDQTYEFVLYIIQCNLLLLSTFYESHIVSCDNGIEVDGSQCSLRQHGLYLAVRHVVYTRIRMHTGTRILAERGYAIVAGYLALVVIETTEVIGVYHQAHGVLRSYARHRGHDSEYLGELLSLIHISEPTRRS